MTADELRAIDAEVAVKVMGARLHPVASMAGDVTYETVPMPDGSIHDRQLAYYSTDLRAAWEVVGKMGAWMFDAQWGFLGGVCCGDWQPIHANSSAAGWTVTFGEHSATEPTAPLAICKAALAAVAANVS